MTATEGHQDPPDDHYVSQLAIEVAMDSDVVHGSAPVRAETFAPGTSRIRTGVLATMVDLVAGHTPNGPVGPTVDLRLQVFSPPPTTGHVRLACRALRAGRRLIVSETVLTSDAGGPPFARALATFMNISVGPPVSPGPRPIPDMEEASIDEFVGARPRSPNAIEVDPVFRLSNGIQGTVQGGVQALVAEMAAEHAVGDGRRYTASDLDIRYLNRLDVGPLVATAELVPGTTGQHHARVTLSDGGNDDRIVAFVAVTLRPATD